MKLGTEHIPFPCSLRELVQDRFAEPPGVGSNAHPMQTEELLEYLKQVDDFSLSPWVAIMEKTEAIGDPAAPSREQTAILRWVGKALEAWEKEFPLEGRLAGQVRRLKPLLAALAIVDPKFMQPGAHPVHQLLDTIQARAIGWQSRLDRVGAILEQQVTRAVDESRMWFDNQSLDLVGICREFSTAAERDQARAQRMVQRVVETEEAKVRTATARQEAARMINAALEEYSAPAEIGEFLKGPWYSSAQLLLLKFGSDSEQWQEMSATTDTLLDSLQSLEEQQESRRQYIFEVVTRLPKEMRRWLLSLHHDTEAVNESMGLVEFAHLRILRRQALDLQRIEPIEVEGEHIEADIARYTGAQEDWQVGQWFSVDNADTGNLRVQLVLNVEQSQQLLFANMAGLKVLQLSFAQFSDLVAQRKVKVLHSGASFSLSLAHVVGVESVEILDALASALTETELEEEYASADPEEEIGPDPAGDETWHCDSEWLAPEEPAPETGEETPADSPVHDQQEPARRRPAPPKGFLVEQAEEIKAQGGYIIQQPEGDDTGAADLTGQGADIEENQEYLSGQFGDSKPEELPPAEIDSSQERQINLPMGVWIGFHDNEVPMMARLAVHDPEDDYYIFVNRNGVKIRQVSRQEMIQLIDNGLIDILEASSNFRAEVAEVRKTLDHQ